MNLDEMDGIDMALHEIQQMIAVSLIAAETLHGSEEDKGISQMPRGDADLLHFSLYDLDKRIKAAMAMMETFAERKDSPSRQPAVLSIVRDPA